MSLIAYQVNNGMPTPIADRKMYNLASGGLTGVLPENVEGTIYGCVCSKAYDKVIVTDGWVIIQGCIIRVKGEQVSVRLASSGTQNGRLSIKLDVSVPSVEWYSEAATTLPAIGSASYPQENINLDGNVYTVPLCTYTVNGTSISSSEVTNVAPHVSISSLASLSTQVSNLASSTVTNVSYSGGTISQTKNGSSSSIVSAATLKSAMKGLVLYNSNSVNRVLDITRNGTTLTISFSSE